MAKCKGCQADIIWIKTVNGKNMPCNAEKTTIVTEGGEINTCAFGRGSLRLPFTNKIKALEDMRKEDKGK